MTVDDLAAQAEADIARLPLTTYAGVIGGPKPADGPSPTRRVIAAAIRQAVEACAAVADRQAARLRAEQAGAKPKLVQALEACAVSADRVAADIRKLGEAK